MRREEALLKKMERLGIRESDIEESFMRSSGPGGQNVNKVSSAVCLRHIPTGTVVKCLGQRSQSANRLMARSLLVEKIEALERRRAMEEKAALERLKRQKRKRSKASKERILEWKRKHSEKKAHRRKRHSLE
jgi:protein subunit release factor B